MRKSIQKAISLLLTIAIAVSLSAILVKTTVSAETSYLTEGIYEYYIYDGYATIVRCTEKFNGNIVIPSSIGGYPVKRVGNAFDNVFSYDSSIKSITFLEGVEVISSYAFRNCDDMETILLPSSLKKVEYEAFSSCESLKALDLPQNIYLDYGAFSNCVSLEKLNIKNGTTIYGNAFSGCTNLSEVSIPSNTYVLFNAFENCTKLHTLYVNDNCYIESCAFNNCTSLSNINLSNKIMLHSSAFFNTEYYNNEKNWENDVLYINNHLICAKNTISGNYSIKPGTVGIATYAFGHCQNLTNLCIPEGVKIIGANILQMCQNIETVNFPKSVVSIAGADCGLFLQYGNAKTDYIDGLYYIDNCLIYDDGNSGETIKILEGTRVLAGYSLTHLNNVKNIILPDSLESICCNAIVDCNNVTSIIIPKNVSHIEKYSLGYHYGPMARGGGYGYPSYDNKIPGFKIYCYAGTAGMDYAIENGFDYEIIGGADEVEISETSVKLNYKGTSSISTKAFFDNYETSEKIIYKSSNPEVATVDENGNITATGSGTATITATIEGTDISDSCEITVSYAWWQWLIRIFLLGFIWY